MRYFTEPCLDYENEKNAKVKVGLLLRPKKLTPLHLLYVSVPPRGGRILSPRSSSERGFEPSPTGPSVSVKTYLMSGTLKASPTLESL